jgi:hypothetical protein
MAFVGSSRANRTNRRLLALHHSAQATHINHVEPPALTDKMTPSSRVVALVEVDQTVNPLVYDLFPSAGRGPTKPSATTVIHTDCLLRATSVTPIGGDADRLEDSIHVHARATKFVRRHGNTAINIYCEMRSPILTTRFECAS